MKDWVETYLAKDDNEYDTVESMGHMMVEWYNEHGWINASEKFDNVMEGLLVNVRPAIMKRCRELMEACEEKPAETTQDREEWEANQVQLPHPDPQGALATVFSSSQPISQEEHDEHVQELEDWSLELEQLAATIGIDTARGESLQEAAAPAPAMKAQGSSEWEDFCEAVGWEHTPVPASTASAASAAQPKRHHMPSVLHLRGEYHT